MDIKRGIPRVEYLFLFRVYCDHDTMSIDVVAVCFLMLLVSQESSIRISTML